MLVNTMGSYYEVGNSSNNNIHSNNTNFLQRPVNENSSNKSLLESNSMTVPPLMIWSSSKAAISPEAKALAACKSHKEAERRRRKRINTHLATLRTLLPNLIKVKKHFIYK